MKQDEPKLMPSDLRNRDDELDRFWSIDALLPQKRPVAKSRNTDPVELELDPPRNPSPVSHSRLEISPSTPERVPTSKEASKERTVVHASMSPGSEPILHRSVYPQQQAEQPTPDDEYTPDSALIHRVRLYQWRQRYPYYEEFVETAQKLMTLHGKPCSPVKFFSYVPQYSQMNREQLSWYLWLRECIRNGETPDTDYSYLLLYLYELINLSGIMDPAEGQEQLYRVWAGYRDRFPMLNSCLSMWICDYSLIHHLPPPKNMDRRMMLQAMESCSLKEFYVGGQSKDGYVQALQTFCCNYDYRKSKFCTPENQALFEKTVLSVLGYVVELLEDSGRLFDRSGMEDICQKHDAFTGALCSHRVKRRMEIDYCSFSRSHELRFLVTDVIKHTENRLRAHLGIRSRLSIYALPVNLRQQIDAHLDSLLPKKAVQPLKKPKEPPAYEKLYDLPKKPLSLSGADEIERASWSTTKKLVEAFDEVAEEPLHAEVLSEPSVREPLSLPVKEASGEGDAPSLSAAMLPYRAFLQAVLRQDTMGQRSASAELGMLPDAVADAVNELASELNGDILLEDADDGYAVIEDYRYLLNGLE